MLIQIIIRETKTILNTAAAVVVVNMVSRRQFLFNLYIRIIFHCFDIIMFNLTKCEISPNSGDKTLTKYIARPIYVNKTSNDIITGSPRLIGLSAFKLYYDLDFISLNCFCLRQTFGCYFHPD